MDLISSGQSSEDSTFLDASADGSDVFFSTAESLVAQDFGLIDIYDARVGGGLPGPPVPKAPCEGEACQSPASAPEFPTPGSSSYKGPSSSSEAKTRRCANGKAKRFANRAKRLRRASKRVNGLRKKRRLRQKAASNAKRAKRLSRKAKRCRRANRRAR